MAADTVAGWLAIVDDDLRQEVNNLEGPLPSLTGAAYHCQQAAEKLVPSASAVERWLAEIKAIRSMMEAGSVVKIQ